VPGNHDYYDLPFLYGLMAQTTLPLRRLLQFKLDLDIGWHGSYQGRHMRGRSDYLRRSILRRSWGIILIAITLPRLILVAAYEPRRFTRLPNRYYISVVAGSTFRA